MIKATLMIIGVFLLYIPIIYFYREESLKCDEVIFIEGELGMDIRSAYHYENGISIITFCDGKTMRVPTKRIIKIVNK
jgi:hypothetical protein